MRSIRKQRGFFLNPFRFAGTTQSGALSVIGDAEPTMAGAAVATMALSSIAEASVIAASDQVGSGAFSVVAESVATMVGASHATGAASSIAESVVTFVSQPTALACDAAEFDGTNDWLRKTTVFSPAPSSSTKQGIFSGWIYRDATGSTNFVLGVSVGSSYRTQISFADTDELTVRVSPDGGSTIGLQMTTSTDPSTGAWHHILISWDLAAGTEHLYVDGASNESVTARNNVAIDYSGINDIDVGSLGGGSFLFDGRMAEIYFAIGQFLDFSVQANREKFRSAAGKPVSMGTTGSVPTGTVPTIYLHLDDGETANNFAVNRAGSGNLTVTGALATAATSPSD